MPNKFAYLTDEQDELRLFLKNVKEKPWWVYILRCEDGTLYTGITNNPIQRFVNHREGKGAKYTKNNPPLEIMFLEEFKDKSTASKREYQIKQLYRYEKLKLIAEHVVDSRFKINIGD